MRGVNKSKSQVVVIPRCGSRSCSHGGCGIYGPRNLLPHRRAHHLTHLPILRYPCKQSTQVIFTGLLAGCSL